MCFLKRTSAGAGYLKVSSRSSQSSSPRLVQVHISTVEHELLCCALSKAMKNVSSTTLYRHIIDGNCLVPQSARTSNMLALKKKKASSVITFITAVFCYLSALSYRSYFTAVCSL